MDTDDLAPPPKPKLLILETMSIGDLESHIARLEAEIAAARALIAAKRQARGTADSVFKI